MSRGVNKVILVGTCGQDPEVRYLPNGNAVTNLSLATSEQWLDKRSGEKVERTEWHRVSLFGKVAEIAGEYLRKGSQCYIEGKLQTREWEGRHQALHHGNRGRHQRHDATARQPAAGSAAWASARSSAAATAPGGPAAEPAGRAAGQLRRRHTLCPASLPGRCVAIKRPKMVHTTAY